MSDHPTITRLDAMRRLAEYQLPALTHAERADELETMTLEDWSDAPGWKKLHPAVRREFDVDGELSEDPSSTRYDPVLLILLSSRFAGATNAYLLDRLREFAPAVSEVVGAEDPLLPCPCCGRNTISERGSYDICKVCWWEDDGQDNANADKVMGGPNYGVSLTQGRANFLLHGISDTSRDDLRARQDPPEKYACGRHFVLSTDANQVEERDSSWTSRAFDPNGDRNPVQPS